MLRRALTALVLLCIWAGQLWCQKIDMAAVEASELFRSGVRTYHRGAFQSAILSLERSLAIKPDDLQVLEWLASANYHAGYVDAAIRTWRDLTRTDYESAAIKNRLQYATWRFGLGSELTGPPTWVLAYQIRSQRGEVSAFKRPISVRARRDGSLAVVSFAGNQLTIVDVNGTVVEILRGGLNGFDRPFDLLELPTGLIVSELGGRRIVRVSSSGQRIAEFGGAGAPRLLGPQFLAMDSKGYVYVTDSGSGRVHKYESSGSYVLSFVSALQEPTGIAVSGDEIYVAEGKTGRISVFDESGNFLRSLGEGELSAPEGMAFWDDGTLLVADTKRLLAGNVAQDTWTEWGGLEAVAGRLTSVAVDAGGTIYVSDMDKETVHVLTRQQNLIAGNNVAIGRISSDQYPAVTMEVAVTDRYGRPVTGLQESNFLLTEASMPVSSYKMARAPVQSAELEVVVMVDQSLEMAGYSDALRLAVLALYDELQGSSRLSYVAGEVPVVTAPAGTSRLRTAEAVAKGSLSDRWRIDTAVRVAANEVTLSWGRKALVYLTSGGVGKHAFETTSLTECAAALVANHVSFTVVSIGEGDVAAELAYLVRETGGSVVSSSSPRGVSGLARDLVGTAWPVYLLTYTSTTFPDYGRRYLPVKVEVVLPGSSGGDISGYFAPVEQ